MFKKACMIIFFVALLGTIYLGATFIDALHTIKQIEQGEPVPTHHVNL